MECDSRALVSCFPTRIVAVPGLAIQKNWKWSQVYETRWSTSRRIRPAEARTKVRLGRWVGSLLGSIVSACVLFSQPVHAQTKVFQVDSGGTLTQGLQAYYKFENDFLDFLNSQNLANSGGSFGPGIVGMAQIWV